MTKCNPLAVEEKPFYVPEEYVPDVLRGLGCLLMMAQNASFVMPDETLFAVDCLLEYLADDLEAQQKGVKK